MSKTCDNILRFNVFSEDFLSLQECFLLLQKEGKQAIKLVGAYFELIVVFVKHSPQFSIRSYSTQISMSSHFYDRYFLWEVHHIWLLLDSSESCECYERWRIFIPFSLQSMCLYPCQPTQLLPALTPIPHTSTFLYPSYPKIYFTGLYAARIHVRKGPSLPHKYNSICLLH